MIEALGMVAGNEQSKVAGRPQTFHQEDFEKLIEKYRLHHNAVLSSFEG
jgi:hypothetical protein